MESPVDLTLTTIRSVSTKGDSMWEGDETVKEIKTKGIDAVLRVYPFIVRRYRVSSIWFRRTWRSSRSLEP